MQPTATPSNERPVVVIGAGPHGLSVAAHLRGHGVPTRVFGDTLSFWRDTMPSGMLLRSAPRASHIDSPGRTLALNRWAEGHGRTIGKIVSIRDFIDYGRWFQSQAVPDLDQRVVTEVRGSAGAFALTLEDGEELAASRVVVAAGLAPFPHVPETFAALAPELCSHVVARPDLGVCRGQSVAVIGAGQSALETAALVHEEGAAAVELIGRTDAIFWLGAWTAPKANGSVSANGNSPGGHMTAVPTEKAAPKDTWRARTGLHWRTAPTDVGGRFTSWPGAAPDLCRRLPRSVRAPLTYHCIKPAGAYWLPDRLREVTFTLGRSVLEAREQEGRVRLALDDGSERVVDRVLLGTGYSIDVRRYPFLASDLGGRLKLRGGSPILSTGLESSIPGLHFVGAPAAESFGPAMRFVVGTAYTGPAVAQRIVGRTLPVFRWAF